MSLILRCPETLGWAASSHAPPATGERNPGFYETVAPPGRFQSLLEDLESAASATMTRA